MKILLADSNKFFAQSIFNDWKTDDSTIEVITQLEDFILSIDRSKFDIAFLSVEFLFYKNMVMISYLNEKKPNIEIIVLCEAKSLPAAESAVSRGAQAYLLKPISIEVLESKVKKLASKLRQKSDSRLMEDHLLDSLLGDTPEMRKILKTLYKIAPTTSTILITGESGSGKEFLANTIHRLSKRSEEAFVPVNSGAIPENIVESELFGSKKGAFTGAVADKKGLFETASKGTLFLDEVGELSLATQVKLLRFLQNHEIRRVGETENRYLDVRIIAATNQNLQKAMEEGTFREDLYYRLNTFHIHLPPLRKRKVVIPRIIKYFSLKYNEQHGKSIQNIDPAAQMALFAYDYPGNIRELENIIEHAIVLSENGWIRLEDLPEHVSQVQTTSPNKFLTHHQDTSIKSLSQESPSEEIESLSQIEKKHIIKVLDLMKGNKTETANKLGISRATLWRKLKEHEIDLDD